MTRTLTSNDLDKFLDEKPPVSPQPLVVGNLPPQQQQNGLQQTTQLVQQGNSSLTGIADLLKTLNELLKNGASLFSPQSLARKEERLSQGGNYGEYVKQKMQEKPDISRETPFKSVEMSNTQTAEKIYKWFELTLENIPQEMNITEIRTQWLKNKREFIEILNKIMRGETQCIESNVNTVNNQQPLNQNEKPTNILTTSQAENTSFVPTETANSISGKATTKKKTQKKKNKK